MLYSSRVNTCLTYPTSLDYWFNDRLIAARPFQEVSEIPRLQAPSGEEWQKVARGCELLGLKLPVHVLVESHNDSRRPDETRIVHQLNRPYAPEAFGRIGKG